MKTDNIEIPQIPNSYSLFMDRFTENKTSILTKRYVLGSMMIWTFDEEETRYLTSKWDF